MSDRGYPPPMEGGAFRAAGFDCALAPPSPIWKRSGRIPIVSGVGPELLRPIAPRFAPHGGGRIPPGGSWRRRDSTRAGGRDWTLGAVPFWTRPNGPRRRVRR
jgi:hypothetical protein